MTRLSRIKYIFLVVQAVFYTIAGLNHFIHPLTYEIFMPAWLPSHAFLIMIAGVAQIALGLLLLYAPVRIYVAWLIIAMLLVFLAVIHIPQTISYYESVNTLLLISILRLPIQFVLIWWAWIYTRPIDAAPDQG